MTWVYFDDAFPEHEKVIAAGDDGGWLWVCAIAYCNRRKTGGLVLDSMIPRLTGLPKPMALAERLVKTRLFEKVEGGYRVHDYETWQAAAMKAAEEKKAASEAAATAKSMARSEAGKKGAASRWQTDGKPDGKSDGNDHGKPDGQPMANGDGKPMASDGQSDGKTLAPDRPRDPAHASGEPPHSPPPTTPNPPERARGVEAIFEPDEPRAMTVEHPNSLSLESISNAIQRGAGTRWQPGCSAPIAIQLVAAVRDSRCTLADLEGLGRWLAKHPPKHLNGAAVTPADLLGMERDGANLNRWMAQSKVNGASAPAASRQQSLEDELRPPPTQRARNA